MIIVVLPEAAEEFDNSVARYDEKEPGLDKDSGTKLMSVSAGSLQIVTSLVCELPDTGELTCEFFLTKLLTQGSMIPFGFWLSPTDTVNPNTGSRESAASDNNQSRLKRDMWNTY